LQQTLRPEHLAVGIVRFNQGIGVTEHQITRFQFDVELLVVHECNDAERDIARRTVIAVGLFEDGPASTRGRIKKRRRVSGIADRQDAGGGKKCRGKGGGEAALARHRRELAVQGTDQLRLVEEIDVSPHELAQRDGGFGDGVAVAGDIREQQAVDPAGGATRGIINISTKSGATVGLAVNPGVKAAEANAPCDSLAAAPDFHALHVLTIVIGHGGIVGWRREFNDWQILEGIRAISRQKTAPAEPFEIPPACLLAAGCKPNSVSLRQAQRGDHFSGPAVTSRLKQPTRGCAGFRRRALWPRLSAYLALLPVGFALPSGSPRTRCALTAPFHPYRKYPSRDCSQSGSFPAVFFLLHCPSDCSALMLSSTRPVGAVYKPPVCSSDFPRPSTSSGRDRHVGRDRMIIIVRPVK